MQEMAGDEQMALCQLISIGAENYDFSRASHSQPATVGRMTAEILSNETSLAPADYFSVECSSREHSRLIAVALFYILRPRLMICS